MSRSETSAYEPLPCGECQAKPGELCANWCSQKPAPVSQSGVRPSKDEIVAMLHKADGYLSLMHRYRNAPVPEEVRQEMLDTSAECRSLVARVEKHGIGLSEEDSYA